MPTSTKYKYIYGCKRFLIGKYIIQIMTAMKGNNECISPPRYEILSDAKCKTLPKYTVNIFVFATQQNKQKTTKKKDWHCHNQV